MAHGIRPGKWRTWADCVHPPQLRARFSRSGIRYRCLSTAPGQVKSLWERDFCVKCDGAHFGVRFLALWARESLTGGRHRIIFGMEGKNIRPVERVGGKLNTSPGETHF